MKYIYNRIVNKEIKDFNYLGILYTLSGINHMGNIDYYTFYSEGSEPLLVTSTFTEEFQEIIKIYNKIKDVHSHKAVCVRLKAMFNKKPVVENFSVDKNEKYTYTVKYKDIEVYFDLENKNFTIKPCFTILNKNILGDNKDVNLLNSPDFKNVFDSQRYGHFFPTSSANSPVLVL